MSQILSTDIPLFSINNWPGESSLPIGPNAYTYGFDAQCVN